jgi:hypothetical protein
MPLQEEALLQAREGVKSIPDPEEIEVNRVEKIDDLICWACSEPLLSRDTVWSRTTGKRLADVADMLESPDLTPAEEAKVMALRVYGEALERGADTTRYRALMTAIKTLSDAE